MWGWRRPWGWRYAQSRPATPAAPGITCYVSTILAFINFLLVIAFMKERSASDAPVRANYAAGSFGHRDRAFAILRHPAAWLDMSRFADGFLGQPRPCAPP